MHNFSYTRATDISEAVQELSGQARALAGGTNLVDLLKENIIRPERLVDINRLELKGINPSPEGGLRLGALETNADTAYHPEVRKRYPLLSEAILAGASPQLRNMATNGGNLMQRTRCYYFYDVATACNKREPGSGCSALNGYNRIHAILGSSEHCIAVHPSDMCVALAALEAVIQVRGSQGERRIAMADFHRLPGDHPEIDTQLKPDELILAIELPPQGFEQAWAYVKVRDRHSYAFALVSAAVGLELDKGQITAARLALGGVAHKPWRDPEAEALLVGQPATETTFRRAAAQIVAKAQGRGHNDFKLELAQRAVVRALQKASERTSA